MRAYTRSDHDSSHANSVAPTGPDRSIRYRRPASGGRDSKLDGNPIAKPKYPDHDRHGDSVTLAGGCKAYGDGVTP